MVSYDQERKLKKGPWPKCRQASGPHVDTDVTVGDVTAEFLEQFNIGLADGSIVAMGTFGDFPDLPDVD